MLLLTRRIGESVMIGDGVQVRVMSVQGNQVRLGIDAPREVTILRSELLLNSREKGAHEHKVD